VGVSPASWCPGGSAWASSPSSHPAPGAVAGSRRDGVFARSRVLRRRSCALRPRPCAHCGSCQKGSFVRNGCLPGRGVRRPSRRRHARWSTRDLTPDPVRLSFTYVTHVHVSEQSSALAVIERNRLLPVIALPDASGARPLGEALLA